MICPVEETLWSKAFVQERDRFDGADVAHLILRQGRAFDWRRLLRRFECQGCERVLLAHLIMFGFIYPSERDVRAGVGDRALGGGGAERAVGGAGSAGGRCCRSTCT